MDPTERLIRKAREYEILAASHAERAELSDVHGDESGAAVAFVLAAIILREVAGAVEDCDALD